MSVGCLGQEKIDHVERMDSFNRFWNKQKKLVEAFGEAESDVAKHQINQLVFRHFEGKVWDEDVPLTQPMIDHLKIKVEKFNNRMDKDVSSVAYYMMHPDAIHGRHPAMEEYLMGMDRVENYSSNQRERSSQYYNKVTENIRYALQGESFGSGINAKLGLPEPILREIGKLEKRIRESGTDVEKERYRKELDTLLEGKEGTVIRDFIELMQMTNEDVAKLPKGVNSKYNKHVIKAADQARLHLDNLGGILSNGLGTLKENTILAITNQTNKNHALVKNNTKLVKFLDTVDNAIERVKSNMDPKNKAGGGYFPDIHLDQLIQLKSKIDRMDHTKGVGSDFYLELFEAENVIEAMLSRSAIQGHGRAKSRLESEISKNPLFVLRQYENDVLFFNRDQNMKYEYKKVLRNIGDPDIDAGLVRSMREYAEMQYHRTTIGNSNLNKWYNRTIRTLTVVEAAKSMGLGVLGATKNFLSGGYYVFGKGLFTVQKGKELSDRPDIRKVLEEVESEQGFTFSKVSREAFTEGVQSEKGVDVSKYDYVLKDGELVLTYEGDTVVWDAVDAATQKVLHGSLILHRIGENRLRNYMFRTQFSLTYGEFVDNPLWMEKLNPKTNQPYGDAIMRQKTKLLATKHALAAVREYAMGYSTHNKAPGIVGTSAVKPGAKEYVTRGGALLFQFMQWPMGFFNFNAQALKGTADGIRSGYYINKESKNLAALAGLYGGTSLLSIVFNRELTHLVENTVVEDILDLIGLWSALTDDDMPEKDRIRTRGLVDKFSGPFVSDVRHALAVADVARTPDDVMSRIMLGYRDFHKLTEDEQGAATAYRLSTLFGKWKNKIVPDVILGGGGLDAYIMHEFGAYPKAWTRQARHDIGLQKRKKQGGRRVLPSQRKVKWGGSTKRRSDRGTKGLYELNSDLRSGSL